MFTTLAPMHPKQVSEETALKLTTLPTHSTTTFRTFIDWTIVARIVLSYIMEFPIELSAPIPKRKHL